MAFQRTIEDDIIHSCKMLSNGLRCGFDKRLQKYGLTSQQGRILFFVNAREKMELVTHQNDIENHFGLSKSTVSGLVSRLANKGFIEKKQCAPYVEISITKPGKDLVENFKKGKQLIHSKLFKDMSQEDKESLFNYLQELINNFKEEETNEK